METQPSLSFRLRCERAVAFLTRNGRAAAFGTRTDEPEVPEEWQNVYLRHQRQEPYMGRLDRAGVRPAASITTMAQSGSLRAEQPFCKRPVAAACRSYGVGRRDCLPWPQSASVRIRHELASSPRSRVRPRRERVAPKP